MIRRITKAIGLGFILALSLPLSARSDALLSRGLSIIDRSYLFGSKLDPGKLLDSGLEYVEARVPELRNSKVSSRAFVVETPLCRMRLELPPSAASVITLEEPLERTEDFIERCSSPLPEDFPSLSSLLLRGVLSGLDPYSTVFDAERRTEHSIQFRGKLAGIGARIGIRDEHLTLIRVYKDSPAHRSGLRDGDVVRRVDDVSTNNMSVTEAVHRIRGVVGSSVRLSVEREGEPKALTITVVRGMVVIPSVEVHMLDDGIAYAAISHFSQTTPADFRKRVSTLIETYEKDIGRPARGVLVDLRTNSGGSMLGSAAIGNLFLDEGILITTAGRYGAPVAGLTAEIRATLDTPFRELPLAILTSPRTASGSELLAASLRNNDRAVLVGERTFGKGTVQKTYGLGSDAALKLTVGNFLPSGRAIPGGGLTPDVQIDRYVFGDNGLRLPASHSAEELPFWLQTPSWLHSVRRRALAVLPMVERREEDAEEHAPSEEALESKLAKDPFVQLGAELLRRYGSTSAASMLSAAAVWLDQQRREAERKASDELASENLDWRSVAAGADRRTQRPAVSSLQTRVVGQQQALEAGEPTQVTVFVRNQGSLPLYRLRGTLLSKARFLDGRGLLFGYLPPGAERSWRVEVTPPKAMHTSRVLTEVAFYDDRGPIGKTAAQPIVVREAARPRLAYRIRAQRQSNTGVYALHVELENRGDAAAKEIRATVRHPEGNEVEILDGTKNFEELAPGETVAFDLSVKLLITLERPPTLELVVSENEFGSFEKTDLSLRASKDFGPWQDAPEVRLAGYVERNGENRLIVRVHDASGLAWIVSRLDGDQIDYRDLRGRQETEATVTLPWPPPDSPDELRRIVVIAEDRGGLRTSFATDL